MTDHDHDTDECCRPATGTELDSEAVRSAAEDVRKYSRWAARLEVILVGVAAIAFVISAIFAAVAFTRLKELAEANRERQAQAQAAQQFGIDAVNCIRYVLIEHRYVNQEYHDLLLEHFGLPPVSTPHEPDLPKRPTQEQIAKACTAFETQPLPPVVTTTTEGRKK